MIEVVDLVKTFPGATEPVLKGISLSVSRGEVFGIIGRSGAGKSTLVRCLDLLEAPTSGSVRIDGQDVSALRGDALRGARRRIGVVFQGFNLLSSRTVFDNAALPLELGGASREQIRAALDPLLELVGLAGKRDRYPSELSGGEKQRVGIARALASKPALLLCDEATSALDPETTESILDLLDDINRTLSLTIVLVTHEMDVVKRACDRIAVLERGRVVEQGAVFEVFAQPVHDVTRRLLYGSSERDVAAVLAERESIPATGASARLLRVTTQNASADLAVFGDITRRWPVTVRLVAGTVERIRGCRYGKLMVEVEGSANDVQSAVGRLKSAGFDVETLKETDGDARAVA